MGLASSRYIVNRHSDVYDNESLDNISLRVTETYCFPDTSWCYFRKNKNESSTKEDLTIDVLSKENHARAINNDYFTPRISYTSYSSSGYDMKNENIENERNISSNIFNVNTYLIKKEDSSTEGSPLYCNSHDIKRNSNESLASVFSDEVNHYSIIVDSEPIKENSTAADISKIVDESLISQNIDSSECLKEVEKKVEDVNDQRSKQSSYCRVYSKHKSKKNGLFSFQQRYDKVITEDKSINFPIYQISNKTNIPNHHNDKTWDVISEGFRYALNMDNFFVCDAFLGSTSNFALHELCWIRDNHIFNNYMVDNPTLNYKYSNLYLAGENDSHKYLDTLTLLVYRLAKQFSNEQITLSVELTYFPEGHSTLVTSPDKSQKNLRQIKCIYFPNKNWSSRIDPYTSEVCGKIYIDTTLQPLTFEPVFDRLILFWGDYHSHITLTNPYETFSVVIWVNIQSELTE